MDIKCRLCNSSYVKKIYDACNVHGRRILDLNDKFEFFKCGNCQAVFIGQISIDVPFYLKYYSQDYYDNKLSGGLFERSANFFENVSFKIRKKEMLCNIKSRERIRVLDIGCGCGNFLTNLDNKKFDRYGIEINPNGFRVCKEKKLNVYNKPLGTINFENDFFDVITLWHVLEHLEQPKEIVESIRRVLKKDGVLAISTPSTDSLGFKYGGNLWFHLDAPRHLVLYNCASLKKFMADLGFEIDRTRNMVCDFPLDLFWSVRRTRKKYFIYPFYLIFKILSRESVLFTFKKT